MKLTSIRLQNFRSHSDSTFAMDRLNLILGELGAGKTSIAYALNLALTGRCERTTANGAGGDELITSGQKQAIVTLIFAEGAVLTYKRGLTGATVQVKDGDQNLVAEAAKAWIAQHLAPPSVLSAVLDAGQFLKLTEAQQKALLADALKPEPVKVEEAIHHAASDAGRSLPETITSAADVDYYYKLYFEERTVRNREIKALGEIAPPEVPTDLGTLSEVDQQLADLKQQRDQQVQAKSQRLAQYTIARAQHDLEVKRRQGLRQQKTELLAGRTREAIESESLDDKQLSKLQKDLTASEKAGLLDNRIRAHQETVNHKREEIATLTATIARRTVDLDALRQPAEPRVCEECGQSYTPTPVAAEVIAEQERALAREQTLLAAAQKVLAEAEQQLEKASVERRKLGDPDALKAIHERHKKAIALLHELDQLEIQLTQELPEAPAQPDCPEDAEITSLDERLQKGSDYRATVLRLEGQREQYQKQLNQKRQLEQKVAQLDRLCDYFGPKGGLKARLIGGKLPAFRDRMNQALIRFGFYTNFELEPYTLTVAASAPGSPRLKLSQLSESQAYRFSIAFAVALAETTGVNFLAIDRCDMLLPNARALMTEELLESSLAQMLVLAASEPLESYPAVEGVRYFQLFLKDGVTQIEAPTATRELVYE